MVETGVIVQIKNGSTLTQADKSRLEAFKMWIQKRMQKVSWVDEKIN